MKKILSLIAFVSLASAQPSPSPAPPASTAAAAAQGQTWQRMYFLAVQQRDQAAKMALDFQIQAQVAQQEITDLKGKISELEAKIAGSAPKP